MKTYFRFQNFISVWIVILMSKCNAGFVNWHLLKDAVVRNYIGADIRPKLLLWA